MTNCRQAFVHCSIRRNEPGRDGLEMTADDLRHSVCQAEVVGGLLALLHQDCSRSASARSANDATRSGNLDSCS
jgi:hypothetical protein